MSGANETVTESGEMDKGLPHPTSTDMKHWLLTYFMRIFGKLIFNNYLFSEGLLGRFKIVTLS